MKSKRNDASNWNRAIASGSFDGKLLIRDESGSIIMLEMTEVLSR
ncbi:MAG: hypothetical protein ACFFD4_19695 [Candidatus Odinarchaeota archaeon]